MKKRRLTKVASIILAASMILSLTPSGFTFAAEEDTTAGEVITEESTEDSTEITVGDDVVIEETTEAEDVVTEEVTEEVETTEAVTTEAEETNEEKTEETDTEEVVPTFNQIYPGVDITGIDFSGKELLIATEDASIFTSDTEVVSEYNGVYLTRYESVEATKSAYTYYTPKADLVEVNVTFKGADGENDPVQETEETSDDEDVPQQEATETEEIANDGHGEADLTDINTGDDAFSNVNDIEVKEYKKTIALIDSGIDESIPAANIVDKISVIGDDPKDDNGHGTKMAKVITEINPNVQILSIKALDENCEGSASDIYAAIQYAIDAKVTVINLSLSSIATADSELVAEAIKEARENNIEVVVAAGNNNKDAKYFSPGNIEDVFTIGSAVEYGRKTEQSNYGSIVDYYVVADSTSEAAAKFSTYIYNADTFSVGASLMEIENRDDVFTNSQVAYNEETGWDGEKEADGTYRGAFNKKPSETAYVRIKGTGAAANKTYHGELEFQNEAAVLADLDATSFTSKWTWCQSHNIGENLPAPVYGGMYTDWYPVEFVFDPDTNEYKCYDAFYSGDDGVQTLGCGFSVTGTRSKPCYVSLHKSGYKDGTKINPTDAGYKSMEGIQYGLYDDEHLDSDRNNLIAIFTLDANGYPSNINIVTKRATPGVDTVVTYNGRPYIKWVTDTAPQNWYFKEIKTNSNYALDDTEWPATINYDTYLMCEVSDLASVGMIEVYKYASDTKNPLKGAEFTVFSDSACTKVVGKMGYRTAKPKSEGGGYEVHNVTDGNGYATLTGLPAGTYYVKETKAAKGYEASTKTYTVKVKTDSDNTFSHNNVYYGYVFDPDYYLEHNPDVRNSSVYGKNNATAFDHFINHGIKEGRIGSPNFSATEYLEKYSDLRTGSSGWNNMSAVQKSWFDNNINVWAAYHYIRWGALEGRSGRNADYFNKMADEVNNNNSVAVDLKVPNNVRKPVYVYVTKKSSNEDCTKNNPNYDLSTAVYKLYRTRSDATNNTNAIGTWYIDKNGQGVDSSGNKKLVKIADSDMDVDAVTGKYESTRFFIKEISTGKNYKMDKIIHPVDVDSTNIETNPAEADLTDDPIDDPFLIKVIKTIQGSTGGDALEGAEFTLKFYPEDISKNYTFEQLKKKTAKKTIKITTEKHGSDIYAELPASDRTFPIGYLTVEETKAPEGYKINGSKVTVNGQNIPVKMAFKLVSKGDNTTGYDKGDYPYLINDDGTATPMDFITVQNPSLDINVEEQQIRADIEVIKYDERKEGIEGAEFEVLNLDTNESHTFKVDKDGYYCSDAEYVSHSAENGLWFAEGPQGTADTPDDEQRALPVGKYRLTEKDAKGHQKEESIDFEVVDDNDGKPIKIYDKGRGDGLELISDMDMPTLGTKAFAETIDGNIKTVPADKGQTVHDICTYKNLKCGTSFTLIGKLMKKNADGTAEPFLNNGEEVVGRTTFTTKDTYEQSQYEASGEATVEFADLDFTDLEDTEFVVYERLYLGDVSIEDAEAGNYEKKYIDSNNDVVTFPIKHEKADDKDQTITTPGGITTAMGGDGTKNISTVETETVTIVDTVEYFNLHPGTEYEAVGKLYLVTGKDDGKKYSDYSEDELKKMAVKDDDGNVITASTKFTATKANGTVDVTFTFPAAKLTKTEGESVVVFEDCYDNNKVKYFSHAVVTDTQIVNPPSISTTAKGTEGRSELAYNQGKFIDTIHYSNLQANSTFLVQGIAMDKDTKEPLKLNGKEVVAEAEFTTGDANMPFNAVKGDFDLEFKITEDQYADLKDKDIVIFETLYNAKGTLIAVHRDLEDKGQELTISKVQTTLTDKKTGTHVAYPDQETTLIDTVSYKRLIPGKQYEMSGTLMNKSTNKPLLDENGKEITGSTTFTASESGSGTVDVVFKFNAKILKIQGTSIVAFEKVTPSDGTIPVCVHMDINDKEQTVDIPKVGTKVSKSSFGSKDTIKFSDVISYTNLTVGYTYVAKGWLVDSKGTKLTVDGKEISVEKEFKPESPNGTVEVPFPEFSGKGLNGKYVVFEEVYVKVEDAEKKTTSTHLVGEHKDLTDNNQTISVTPGIKTGDSSKLILMILLLVAALMGIGTVIVIKRKRR